jgi:hypothetical protein
MPQTGVEAPAELLADLDRHVGGDDTFVDRSQAVRASIRTTLGLLGEVDPRHGHLGSEHATDRDSNETGETDGN